jgi:hypothetical protein
MVSRGWGCDAMTDELLLAIEQGRACVSDADIRELARLARERGATKPTAPAYVNMIAKTLDGLSEEWVAPEGNHYVVVIMQSDDAGRVPLFSETTIGLREAAAK